MLTPSTTKPHIRWRRQLGFMVSWPPGCEVLADQSAYRKWDDSLRAWCRRVEPALRRFCSPTGG